MTPAVPRVATLYRYPVKGFAPEPCQSLSISAEGRVAGDRVFAFRFASTPAPDDEWSPKPGMLVLMNTPGLARLRLEYDYRAHRLRLHLDGRALADEPLDAAGRERLARAVAEFTLSLDVNPLAGHPDRLPLRLVGDGLAPRYHDSKAGEVSLHGRASLRALAAALGDPQLSELRFRSNVAVEGAPAWEELAWVGRRVRIGNMPFKVTRPKVRCLATQANPETGRRDRDTLSALPAVNGREDPTFAVALLPTAGPGEIHVGDEVRLLGA
jgi:uncharacterized protein YcbX